VLKRGFDILVSVAGIVLLSPILIACAVAVRIDSHGPVLFRQVRVGRHGKPFQILKFRTMVHEPLDDTALITASGDARITRVGRWLRKTKADELPQLMNVLRGDMSLVGPRPEVERYVALYPAEKRDVILSVRPGITDEASIRFRDEGDLLAAAADPERYYVTVLLPRKLEIYERYARTHSFIGDLLLLWRTVLALVR
jgi:lipopolysaccharide/colanic/teichoic acid biosynthesis glycosyltransferase